MGIRCGEASGVDVLDVDTGKKAEAQEWLDAHPELLAVATRRQRTQSGGWHVFFQHRPGLKNWVARLGPGIDVRTNGGYTIAWDCTGLPLEHPDVFAPWPEPLFAALQAGLPRDHAPSNALTAEPTEWRGLPPGIEEILADAPPDKKWVGRAMIGQAVAAIRDAQHGSRNQTLNDEAYKLRPLVEQAIATPAGLAALLKPVAVDIGLSEREVTATLASALRGAVPHVPVAVLPPPPPIIAPTGFGITTHADLALWLTDPPPPPEFIIGDFVERGAVALLAGEGGSGKSLVALQAMVAVATGKPFLGRPVMQGRAAGLFCEDSRGALYHRLRRLCATGVTSIEHLVGRVFPMSLVDADPLGRVGPLVDTALQQEWIMQYLKSMFVAKVAAGALLVWASASLATPSAHAALVVEGDEVIDTTTGLAWLSPVL
ncbi:MAG: AAA family ATPase [Rhodopila sp.]